jgi:hypothetical protein
MKVERSEGGRREGKRKEEGKKRNGTYSWNSIFASIHQEYARTAAVVNDEEALSGPTHTSVIAFIRSHSRPVDTKESPLILRRTRRSRERRRARQT